MRLMSLCIGVVLIAWKGIRISIPRTPLLVVAGFACLVNFLRLDAIRDGSRLLPRKPLSLKNPVGARLTMILCFTSATIAINVYGPFLITKLHQVYALTAGYVVACASIGWSIAAVPVSGMPEKYDCRMITLGMLVLTMSIVGFIYCVANGPVWLIAVFRLIEGAGFGISWTLYSEEQSPWRKKAKLSASPAQSLLSSD